MIDPSVKGVWLVGEVDHLPDATPVRLLAGLPVQFLRRGNRFKEREHRSGRWLDVRHLACLTGAVVGPCMLVNGEANLRHDIPSFSLLTLFRGSFNLDQNVETKIATELLQRTFVYQLTNTFDELIRWLEPRAFAVSSRRIAVSPCLIGDEVASFGWFRAGSPLMCKFG